MSNPVESPKRKNAPKKEGASPLLDRILYGGSSVTLNLLRHDGKTKNPMFSNPRLNRTYIFKYPNFQDTEVETESVYDPERMAYVTQPIVKSADQLNKEADESPRPIETGIFIPYDNTQPELGGQGIYLRKHNYKEMAQSMLGVDFDGTSPEERRDADVMATIDTIPSLDPFLLKEALLKRHPDISEIYFEIQADEAQGIKDMITAKLMPILNRALKDVDEHDRAMRSRKFLEAIWNPALPEAQMFISAFGIGASESVRIFEALKGISFYEWNVKSGGRLTAQAVQWLQSKDTLPHDIRQHQAHQESLLMFREKVLKRIKEVTRQIGEIFREYTEAHQHFQLKDDARPFRTFLRSVNRHYWSLGYASTALAHVGHLHSTAMRGAVQGKLSFAATSELLQQMSMALQSTIKPPATI